jgi:hypothetical protein
MEQAKVREIALDMIFKFSNKSDNAIQSAADLVSDTIKDIKKTKGTAWEERVKNMELIKAEILNNGR